MVGYGIVNDLPSSAYAARAAKAEPALTIICSLESLSFPLSKAYLSLTAADTLSPVAGIYMIVVV